VGSVLFGKSISLKIIITVKKGKMKNQEYRNKLRLEKKEELAKDIFGFWFNHEEKDVSFLPGQFLEWELKHNNPDNRGEKRFFTIASAPTESGFLLATKITKKSSTFKRALKNITVGENIETSGPFGDFVLSNTSKKLVFLAGGIGITPFRSIIKNLIDKKTKKDITIFYAVESVDEITFQDIFLKAEKDLGIKTVFVVNKSEDLEEGYESGRINKEIIEKYIPNKKDCLFYVSGPSAMVKALSEDLKKQGVEDEFIKKDYFPGYDL